MVGLPHWRVMRYCFALLQKDEDKHLKFQSFISRWRLRALIIEIVDGTLIQKIIILKKVMASKRKFHSINVYLVITINYGTPCTFHHVTPGRFTRYLTL